MAYGYIEVSDLVFNGADCTILDTPPKGQYVSIEKQYSWARDTVEYPFYYRGVLLGLNRGYLSRGSIERVAAAIRGRGVWEGTRFDALGLQHEYRPFWPNEEKVVKRAGVWAFQTQTRARAQKLFWALFIFQNKKGGNIQ